MSFEHLLRPKTFAIVGATEKIASFGNFAATNALQNDIRVYFVNNSNSVVFGKKTYNSLEDLPEVCELVLISTPKATVPSILEQAGKLGTKAAIIIAGGYSEEGSEQGKNDEKELKEIAIKYDMKVMGPNCIGMINNVDKIKAWAMGGTDFDMEKRDTGIAMFAQSGTVAMNILGRKYCGISYAFSTGNGNILPLEEILDYVIDDTRVKVACIYLEGIKNPAIFEKALKKAALLKKPIVIHKSGTSQIGAASAASHTGNLAGETKTYKALFKKFGVIFAESFDELIITANSLNVWADRLPKGTGFAGLNGSGGENTVFADMCEKYGINLPQITQETKIKLTELLPSYGTPRNPLDITAGAAKGRDTTLDFMNILGSDPNIDALMMGLAQIPALTEEDLIFAKSFGSTANDRYASKVVEYVETKDSVPVFVIPSTEDCRDVEWRMKLQNINVPVLTGGETGYKILSKICEYIGYDVSKRTLKLAIPNNKSYGKTKVNSELESKKLLAENGIMIPKQGIAKNSQELKIILEDIKFPIVLKISSKDIPHKTEAGGVKLNIANMDQALDAYSEILNNCRSYNPNAMIDGVLVQEMLPQGNELILGIVNDLQFGPMIMAGLGGVFVEIFKDVAFYPCPMNKYEALETLKMLKGFKLLEGYRGSKPCDIDALVELMVKLSEIADKKRDEIKEIDINPVFVYSQGEGVAIADALIVEYCN